MSLLVVFHTLFQLAKAKLRFLMPDISLCENIMSSYIDCKMTTRRTTVRRVLCTTFRRGALSIAPEVVKAGFVA